MMDLINNNIICNEEELGRRKRAMKRCVAYIFDYTSLNSMPVARLSTTNVHLEEFSPIFTISIYIKEEFITSLTIDRD